VFGPTSGKLLGFIVSQQGIEVDPSKIKAIVDMPAPKTQKEARVSSFHRYPGMPDLGWGRAKTFSLYRGTGERRKRTSYTDLA
jgi:hypothetical protein